MKMKRIGLVMASCIALWLPTALQAQSQCLKEVFYKYCLGGGIKSLLSRHTPTSSSDKGGSQEYVFADGSEQTRLRVSQGRIETVSRYYPGTSQSFDQVSEELRKLYGEPTRTSPDQGARYVHIWVRQGWRVRLEWPNTGNIRLVYVHDGLYAARKSAGGYGSSNPKGF